MLRQAEDADPSDPFAQGLRNRYNELEAEQQTVLLAIAELDSKEAKQPDRLSLDAVDRLEALPEAKVNLHPAPQEVLNRLFDLAQLIIQIHHRTGGTTLTVTLPGGQISDVAETVSELEEKNSIGCSKMTG